MDDSNCCFKRRRSDTPHRRALAHITEEHAELAGSRLEILETIANPTRIFTGNAGELLAVRDNGAGKWFVVVYRELNDDGFVITAFITRRFHALERRKQLWP